MGSLAIDLSNDVVLLFSFFKKFSYCVAGNVSGNESGIAESQRRNFTRFVKVTFFFESCSIY